LRAFSAERAFNIGAWQFDERRLAAEGTGVSHLLGDGQEYASRDRAVWNGVFDRMPDEWYRAPPSDAMIQCRAYFRAHPCRRLLDVGCGFGRWAQFVAGQGVEEVIGLDYSEVGVRTASAWARRDGFNARFVVGSAMALPFQRGLFDGALVALLLDNLSRADCSRAVGSLNDVLRAGARGFFAFSPVLTPAEAAAMTADNPTSGCMHVVYDDHELEGCLSGWSVTRVAASTERLRLIEATFTG
jgi:ubiquinone/menaquinone biosynthesis C-methylase UbiE